MLKVVFAGGGTGGHLFPALNIAKAMEARWPCTFLFFGTHRGIEKDKVPAAGYNLIFIPVSGLQRRLTFKNLLFPLRLWRSMRIVRRELKKFQPHLVIGTGGYVMGPVLRQAHKLGYPIVMQEQNSYPGVTTRLLAKKAEMVYLAYEETKNHLPQPCKTMLTGNPIRPVKNDISREAACAQFGLDPGLKTLLVSGGSQGAASINRAIDYFLETEGIPDGYQILWQTGKMHFERYTRKYTGFSGRLVLTAFIDNMSAAYKLADFAVCRAGAMTLSELMAAGLPAILVPYPAAAADHQYKNARTLEKTGAAFVVRDTEKLNKDLAEAIRECAANKEMLVEMSRKMAAAFKADATNTILQSLAGIIKKYGFEL